MRERERKDENLKFQQTKRRRRKKRKRKRKHPLNGKNTRHIYNSRHQTPDTKRKREHCACDSTSSTVAGTPITSYRATANDASTNSHTRQSTSTKHTIQHRSQAVPSTQLDQVFGRHRWLAALSQPSNDQRVQTKPLFLLPNTKTINPRCYYDININKTRSIAPAKHIATPEHKTQQQ